MEPRHRPRLLLADDHTLIAEACRALLEPEFEVVAIVRDGRELLRAAGQFKPDLIVADIGMPLLNGLDAGEQVKNLWPTVKLVYLTMQAGPDLAAEAFRRGASAYLLKSSAADELITAIRKVLRGESYLSTLITKDTVGFLLRSGKTYVADKQITPRQREVLQLLAEGKSMKEVATLLRLKPGTVAFHKYRIMSSLSLKTNAELLQYAIAHHMLA
ncbi:MAG TPA: response regulator transcription factor [Terriglobales bacterium]|nr:response regulator transcription factor [Terriglobales bacterium]